MKQLTWMILFLVTGLSQASADQTWSQPVLQCDGAKLEDICWNSTHTRPTYPYEPISTTSCRRQLFVYGGQARDFFLDTGMVFPNASGEAILPELKPIANSPDLVDETFAYSGNGRVLFVKRERAGLRVESFRTTQPTGGMYVQRDKVADYLLVNCR